MHFYKKKPIEPPDTNSYAGTARKTATPSPTVECRSEKISAENAARTIQPPTTAIIVNQKTGCCRSSVWPRATKHRQSKTREHGQKIATFP